MEASLLTRSPFIPHQGLIAGTAGTIYTVCRIAPMIIILFIRLITVPGGGAAVMITQTMCGIMLTMLPYFHLIKTENCNGAMLFIKSNMMMMEMTAFHFKWLIPADNFTIFSIW